MVHGQWWLENCSQHCLKRMEADSLSSAVVEVKISGFVLKIRSLRGAMCEFDGTQAAQIGSMCTRRFSLTA